MENAGFSLVSRERDRQLILTLDASRGRRANIDETSIATNGARKTVTGIWTASLATKWDTPIALTIARTAAAAFE